ncbi:hypothetical protein ACHAQJ_003512 [Trichoderma viride]
MRTSVSQAKLTKNHSSDAFLTSLSLSYVQSLRTQINRLEQQVRQRGGACDTGSPNAAPFTTPASWGVPSPAPLSSTSATRPHRRWSQLTFKTSPLTIPPQHDTNPVTAMGAAVPARMVSGSLEVNKQYYGQSSIVSLLWQTSRNRTRTENSQHAETQRAKEARRVSPAITMANSASALLLHDQFCLPPRRVADALLDVY